MTTLQTMRNRIADETGRTDLLDQIDKAIMTAIQTYQNERFTFTLAEYRINTVIAQEAYVLPDDLKTVAGAAIPVGEDLLQLDGVINRTGAVASVLRPCDRQWLDLYYSTAGTNGIPSYYNRRGATIRLGPVPNAVFNVYLTGVKKLVPLSGSSSSNAWMIEGEALVRNRSKCILARDVLRDPDLLAACQAAESEAFDDLKRQMTAHTIQPLSPPNFQVRSDGTPLTRGPYTVSATSPGNPSNPATRQTVNG